MIGAGAGLSTSAGFVYEGERFQRYFSDFEEAYGFHDMYSGGFYPYKTPEEFWAYWSRYIYVNRYMIAPKSVYSDLLELVKDKDYFVITTNVDHQFQKAGFDKERLFYTQGDYGLVQCSRPCCQKTYDNEALVKEMIARQEEMKIPSELVPRCPVCGGNMAMHLRCDQYFVEEEHWHEAAAHYADFLRGHRKEHVVLLELGVGFNTPTIIRFPFEKMVRENERWSLIRLNLDEAVVPESLGGRAVGINEDIARSIQDIKSSMEADRYGKGADCDER